MPRELKAAEILSVDVGNTSTACTVFRGETIVHRRHVPTPKKWRAGHFCDLLSSAWAAKITAVPASPIGANTANSIRAGIFFGHIGTLSHLITLYREILGPGSKVIATGGLIRYFRGQVPGIDRFEPDLLFYGLKSVYDQQPRPA